MKKNTLTRFVLLASISIAIVTASAQDSHSHSAKQTADPSWSELVASMNQMHAVMHSVESSGNSDTDFVRLMLPHHQGAIDMAKAELMHGQDPQMRRLAQEIITDQESEIELMQLWLRQHDGQESKPATSAERQQ
jgi:uncharacterized protein (DUF305 family)